ncbi:MAG: magnesium chelatase domain-containing protein, partial [Pseudomonadota bacterium]
SMILAVLEARAGVSFQGLDVYLNVAGGLRVSEPAADLAVAAALLSAREDTTLPEDLVLFGEVALSGAIRPVPQMENRLKEAQKLGFTAAVLPKVKKQQSSTSDMELSPVVDLASFVSERFGAGHAPT